MDKACLKCELPGGMRLLFMPRESDVTYAGIAIAAGTRHELPDQFGMAHFVEHMLFKGTQRRKAWHILNRMEAVGGDLNAFTNKEETFVHATFMRQHLERAAELLSDIVFHSIFPPAEIEKETEVIVEEIESYNDNPAERIYDDFENIIFQGHPLGHDILGTAASVRSFTSPQAKAFTQRLYRPERMVFFVRGNYEPAYVQRVVTKALSAGAPSGPPPRSPHNGGRAYTSKPATIPHSSFLIPHSEGGLIERHLHTHQAHVMIGRCAYGCHDPQRYALLLLNNILGGPGMNSRLNLALRERRGLVYTIESTITQYTDTATLSIYFGCDPHDINRCLRLVHQQLRQLSQQTLSPRQLTAALRQISGQIGIAKDQSENYLLDLTKGFLHTHTIEDAENTLDHLRQLTPDDLQHVADDLLRPEQLTTLIYC